MLIREIASGRLVDGQKLPPEREMAQAQGTTVRTLRKALAELEEKGLLERRQGSGNYIRANAGVTSVYSMFRLERRDGAGGLPTADILDVAQVAKEPGMPSFGVSDRGTRIRRLRYIGGLVVAIEEIWLDLGVGALRPGAVQDSLYRTYQQQFGLRISRAEDRVGIAPVPAWAPASFAPVPGSVTGFVERLSWAQATLPVEFSRTWFDTTRAQYVQRLI